MQQGEKVESCTGIWTRFSDRIRHFLLFEAGATAIETKFYKPQALSSIFACARRGEEGLLSRFGDGGEAHLRGTYCAVLAV